jgi:hypothetical protein
MPSWVWLAKPQGRPKLCRAGGPHSPYQDNQPVRPHDWIGVDGLQNLAARAGVGAIASLKPARYRQPSTTSEHQRLPRRVSVLRPNRQGSKPSSHQPNVRHPTVADGNGCKRGPSHHRACRDPCSNFQLLHGGIVSTPQRAIPVDRTWTPPWPRSSVSSLDSSDDPLLWLRVCVCVPQMTTTWVIHMAGEPPPILKLHSR